MTTAPTPVAGPPAAYALSPQARRVFIGLMLGMFVASVSQTIVGPAMPRIVAELGGMEHYSWVATAAMLVSAIIVPIVGKLSDLYGRRGFYLAGLVVFMVGSLICGFSQGFWMLVFGRAVQGLGMGTIMPLSQTIIGDIIPPRQRGKYQGLMGAVFGVTSVAGPLAGGFVTDRWGWRWLFFVTIPVGLLALVAVSRFLHLEHERRDAKVDIAGILTLTPALVATLLATSWGGTTYPWGSATIIGLYVGGFALLALFCWVELRAEEPILPLRLFRNSVFTFSNIAAFAIAMMMFGAIIYIPVFAQGVIGVDATNSGLILMPLMLGLITMGIVAGLITTRTGRYKELMISGVLIMLVGVWLLSRMTYETTQTELTLAMLVFGVGLGLAMQLYTLVVQNAATRRDLGVATASTQFFRNVGSTVGIALFGTIMTSGLGSAIAAHLPADAAAHMPEGGIDAGSVLDPAALEKLPPAVAVAVRQGLAEQLHEVFLLGFPILAAALIVTLFIRVMPLRDTVHGSEEAGREMLDSLGQSAPATDELVPGLHAGETGARTRERILGVQLSAFATQAGRADRTHLTRAVVELGDGDLERGRQLLLRTADMLANDDLAQVADAERFAGAVADRAMMPGGLLSADLRKDLAVAVAAVERRQVLSAEEPTVAERHTAVDVRHLFSAAGDLGAALAVDLLPGTRTGGGTGTGSGAGTGGTTS
ncbi:MDR family MFS transporter [Janibacter sp. G56]|uniref:MDR family MFS transporter n=1 Tax=Janibacter sp. G56 TaxID=3418717 RepID=UPI003D0445F8